MALHDLPLRRQAGAPLLHRGEALPGDPVHAGDAALGQLKGCLADGYPFVFGFSVYASFESSKVARDGHAPLPKAGEEFLGGHAVLAVGYDEQRQWFICRNSWGPKWGMKGYFTLPYPYLVQPSLASDFWTIRSVEEG